MSIPKKIHYCWYSGEEKDERTKRCIDSWHKHLPDYEIIEWNTSNCDINETEFTKTAFEAGKWAQVADYFRLKILYENGGIYLDADVLVNSSFDRLLPYKAFFPIEGYEYVINAVMGAVPGCEVIKKMIQPYLTKKYENAAQILSYMHYMTHLLAEEYGMERTGFTQILKDDIAVLSSNVLLINVDDGNNICEHLYAGAWLDEHEKYKPGASYKYIVFEEFFYNKFRHSESKNQKQEAGVDSDNIRAKISQNSKIKELLSTIEQGIEYIKSNPDSKILLIDDIYEAVDVISTELNIEKPMRVTDRADEIATLEHWLQKTNDSTVQINDNSEVVNELVSEINRINNSITVTNVSITNFGPAKFYSTCGEDALLLRVFFNGFTKVLIENGTYVDVGAHHPRHGSNTYVLNKLGWSGINIEANPAAIPIFERERINDINLNYAVGKDIGDIDFYLFGNVDSEYYGQSSTTDADFAKQVSNAQNAAYKHIKVQGRRLDDILTEYLGDRQIDFMNIDVESKEMDVLESNNWDIYRPLVMAIEINPESNSAFNIRNTLKDSCVIKYLEHIGYFCFSQTLVTWFFYDSRSERKFVIENWTKGY